MGRAGPLQCYGMGTEHCGNQVHVRDGTCGWVYCGVRILRIVMKKKAFHGPVLVESLKLFQESMLGNRVLVNYTALEETCF